MKPSTCFALFLFLCASISGQTFQTPLQPGRISPVTDAVVVNPTSILFSSYVTDGSFLNIGDVNLTQLDYTEGTVWSQDYLYPSGVNTVHISRWKRENAFLLSTYTDQVDQNKVLTKIDEQGNVLWSKRLGADGDINPVNLGLAKTAIDLDGNAILLGGPLAFSNENGVNDLFISKVAPDGTLIWGKTLCFSCLGSYDATIGALLIAPNGDIVVAASVNPVIDIGIASDDVLLFRMRPDGTLFYTYAYNLPEGLFGSNDIALDIGILPSGNILIAGFTDSFSPSFKDGLLMEVNADGEFIQASRFNLQGSSHDVQINNLEVVDNETVVLSFSSVENTNPTQSVENNFLGQFRLGQGFDWVYNYFSEIAVGYLTQDDVLVRGPNGGYTFMPNDAETFDALFPWWIVTDAEGRTGCEQDIEVTVDFDVELIRETLVVPTADALTVLDYLPTTVAFDGYELAFPQLELGPDTSFCGPFSLGLDADIGQSAEYLWSTGATSSAITVGEAGLYSVEVFVPTTCLRLRDTLEVESNGILEVDSLVTICNGAFFDFFGQPINSSGIYTYTIESPNACDTLVRLDLTVQNRQFGVFQYEGCEGDGFSVTIAGELFDEANPSGTVLLNTTAGCDSLLAVDLNFQSSEPFLLGQDIQTQAGALLTFDANDLPFSFTEFSWFTNTTEDFCTDCTILEIEPETSGVVQLTLTNATGCSSTGTLEITLEEIEVFIPNIFTPNQDGFNDTFQAYANAPNLIVNRFEVYDRWGGLVFSGPDNGALESVAWDGTADGKVLESGVYVYLIEMTFPGGETHLFLEDVTLLR